MFPFNRDPKDPQAAAEALAPAPKAPEAHPLDALTGGVFSAATSGERAQRVRDWLATEPAPEQMQEVFKELSAKDKGAAKALREKLDELRRAKGQDAVAAEWQAKAQALLEAARLNIADALAWQRDAAKAGAPLSREPLAGLRTQLVERIKAVEDLQQRVMVQREAAACWRSASSCGPPSPGPRRSSSRTRCRPTWRTGRTRPPRCRPTASGPAWTCAFRPAGGRAKPAERGVERLRARPGAGRGRRAGCRRAAAARAPVGRRAARRARRGAGGRGGGARAGQAAHRPRAARRRDQGRRGRRDAAGAGRGRRPQQEHEQRHPGAAPVAQDQRPPDRRGAGGARARRAGLRRRAGRLAALERRQGARAAGGARRGPAGAAQAAARGGAGRCRPRSRCCGRSPAAAPAEAAEAPVAEVPADTAAAAEASAPAAAEPVAADAALSTAEPSAAPDQEAAAATPAAAQPAEELVPAMGGRKLQEAIRKLREEWKTADQGGPPNHALWKRFDRACNAAHKFVDAWLDQVRAESAQHRRSARP
jgi:hypothetical protein